MSARSSTGTDWALSSNCTWTTACRPSLLTRRVAEVASATALPSSYWARPAARSASPVARSALAASTAGRPAAICARSPGIEGSVGLVASSWSSRAWPPFSWPSPSCSLARPASSAAVPSSSLVAAAVRSVALLSRLACAANGSFTRLTCGTSAQVANTSWAAARCSSVMAVPSVLCSTTVPAPPAASGISSPSPSMTFWKVVPGMEIWLVSGLPTVPARTPRPTRMTSQMVSVRHAWAAHQRPRRYRREDMGAFSRWEGGSGGARGDGDALGVQAGSDVADRCGEAVPERGGAVGGCRGNGIRGRAAAQPHPERRLGGPDQS